MKNILLIEDEENLNRGISLKLKKEGYAVFSAACVSEGLKLFQDNTIDLVICDIGLPDGSGLDLCANIRQRSDVLFLFLTALDTEVDVITGYEMGADDYVTKPFSMSVLVSKISAMLKRTEKAVSNIVQTGKLTFYRQPVQFTDYLFHTQQLQNAFNNYAFSNNRAITKAMLTWWAFQNSHQKLLSLESVLEIEHIYARSRQEKEHSLSNPRNIESLGNKALLEKRINIRASDYRFSDKVKYYTGFENNRKQRKEGTKIEELTVLAATATDFTESDIVERNAKIIFNFVEFMHSNGLLCED